MRMRECVDLATERCVLRLYSSICMRIEIFKLGHGVRKKLDESHF